MRDDYFQDAIREYQQADHHLKLAQNVTFRAHVKNNVGFLLFKLYRFKEAHSYLDEALRLATSVKDKVKAAQIEETKAQVFLAENRLAEAERAASHAAASFAKVASVFYRRHSSRMVISTYTTTIWIATAPG